MIKRVRNYLKECKNKPREKRGAVALEVILVAGMIIALTVGLLSQFGDTIGSSGDVANDALENAIEGKEIQR